MRADRCTAIVDACVLAGALTRNLVLTLAEAGFFRPRWSDEILVETERAICAILTARGAADAEAAAKRHCAAITRAFPEALVEHHEALVPALNLPDANDRHVLAAAVQARATVVVTDNVRDFPAGYLGSLQLSASTTDDFLADMVDLDIPAAVAALRTMRLRFKKPELDGSALLTRMEGVGLARTVDLLAGHIDSL